MMADRAPTQEFASQNGPDAGVSGVGDTATLCSRAIAAWRDALTRSLHGPGCSCCGAYGIRLVPAWLAEDIEHSLRTRYSAAGLNARLALLDAHPFPQSADFSSRIAALAKDGAPEASHVLQDIIDSLESIGRSARAGPFTAV